MRPAALLGAGLSVLPAWVGAQALPLFQAAARAESLHAAGRPWHAAETLIAAAGRGTGQDAAFIVQTAEAELRARRADRAHSLLAGQPWLESYLAGEGLAVLAEAEARMGRHADAAGHYQAAHARAHGPRAALWRVRAGLAFEAAGLADSAAAAFGGARATGLDAIEAWLRVREARVTRDSARAMALLAELPFPAARDAPAALARARLNAGDSVGAVAAFAAAGRSLDAARVALALNDSARARAALYDLLAGRPESDDAAAAVALALRPLPPRTAAERVALARVMQLRGDPAGALSHASRAAALGDSSGATLVLLGELEALAGRFTAAERSYRAAARDSVWAPLALYRRARVLVRLGDPGAPAALSGFAQRFPADTAAPTALYLLADLLVDRGDAAGGARWFGELVSRYPADVRSSQARFRLAASAWRAGRLDSAASLYRAEVGAAAPQRAAARFWLGRIAARRGDSAGARASWAALAREDSVGYYGLRARRAAGLAPLTLRAPPPAAPPPLIAAALARLDTLVLAGLEDEARTEVRALLARPPLDLEALLAWSGALAARGWGPAAVRLAWQAAAVAPGDARLLPAIYPWPNRAATEAEAAEFGVDPFLFAALVRQESVFDPEALSPAGARGLAQLLPGTAAATARGLDVAFYADWITVPDLNLHLGAAHFADLQRRFPARSEAAVAAYNAGARPVTRWLSQPGADDVDQFIELIGYPETRGYVRSVFRNRAIYRALYGSPTP